jgi:hypothetical protein
MGIAARCEVLFPAAGLNSSLRVFLLHALSKSGSIDALRLERDDYFS